VSNVIGGTYKVGAKAIKVGKTLIRRRGTVSVRGAENTPEVLSGAGTVSSKEKAIPDYIQELFDKGNQFNRDNRHRYPYNEITVDGAKKNRVVDSYIPGKEIVSRKLTQLSEIAEKTAIGYIDEIIAKYPPGTKITDGPFNPNVLKGDTLQGQMILEIPVQNNPIPQRILDVATEKKVSIRDIEGKVYN